MTHYLDALEASNPEAWTGQAAATVYLSGLLAKVENSIQSSNSLETIQPTT